MQADFPNINTLWSRVLVDELARCGLRRVVISPGARSTPLVLAFSNHPDITAHSVIDERAAGFVALGLAKGDGNPAALLCTSGTAAANYLPAVCEANLSDAPLLILTADRPAHLRDSGAPQTMDQTHLYGRHVRWFSESAQPEADAHKLRALRSTACYAIALCNDRRSPGPVHLNIPFRKPLEPTPVAAGHAALPETLSAEAQSAIAGRRYGRPWQKFVDGNAGPDALLVARVADALRLHKRILVIAGPDSRGRRARRAAGRFAAAVGTPVFAEASSQLRFDPMRAELVLGGAAAALSIPAFAKTIRPDLILRLGAAPTTDALQKFLASCEEAEQIAISNSIRRNDPDHLVSAQIATEPSLLLEALADEFEQRPHGAFDHSWARRIVAADAETRAALADALEGLDDAFVGEAYHRLHAVLPDGAALVVSSSMPIRDLETYLTSSKHDIDVFFNRGVNGIDGITATATGIARARGGTTVLLTGDIAFLHDLDGLLACRNSDAALTIVVINNNGGEIFNQLAVREFEPAFTEHFVTPHGMNLEAIARAFRIEYHSAEDAGHYSRLLEASVAASGTRIIEFRSNTEAARSMRAFVAGKVEKALEDRPVLRSSTTSDEAEAAALAWRLLRRGPGRLAPVILLHGFTRSGASWEQAAKFMSAGRSVIAVDLPGHGSSPCPQSVEWYSFERLDDMLLSVLDRIGTDRAHLAGYSLGGRAALHFALSHPERVAGLALISASPGIEDQAARERRLVEDRRLARRILEEGLESFVDGWAGNPVLTRRVHMETARRREKNERMSGSSAGYALALEGLGQGAMNPLWTVLPGLTIPTLVIAGDRDGGYSDISRRMAELIPDSKLVIVPDCGHDAPAESPEAVAAALDGFWDGI